MAEPDQPPSPDPLLAPGRNCWRRERAARAALIVDAADYFRTARAAMLNARSQILLVGWDVDTRVRLDEEKGPSGAPLALGPLLSWIARRRPELNIYILAWDEGMISVPGRGTTFFRMMRWSMDKQITIKWDSTHPLDASHHQKILVVDDALAFCGGIDITGERWDTRDHKDEEPGRKSPFTRRSYEPWHDATMAVDGEVAKALGELARKRWESATRSGKLPDAEPGSDPWPEGLEPTFRDVDIAIARTRGHEEENSEVREIEALFLDLIACAKHHVYFETQYFASRRIAEAICKRLEEPDGPEFVVINPKTAEGWLDEEVMSPARALLMRSLQEKDRHGHFRIYTPVTEQGLDIYVHAKIMIVDDKLFRIGSANLNNRSMGLDSECDLMIDGRDRRDVQRTIARLRCDLLAEHLDVERDEIAKAIKKKRSLIGAIEALRGKGRTLMPFVPEPPNATEEALAKAQLLDPEAPNELFDPRTARPGLLSRLRPRR